MEIIKKNENGSFVIDSKAMEEMAMIACDKVKDIIPFKEDKYADCRLVNGEIVIEMFVKLKQGSNVDEICKEVQRVVFEHIFEMTSIKVKHVDVNIQGFISR